MIVMVVIMTFGQANTEGLKFNLVFFVAMVHLMRRFVLEYTFPGLLAGEALTMHIKPSSMTTSVHLSSS